METVEVVLYTMFALIVAGMILAMLSGWDYNRTYDSLKGSFFNPYAEYEKITADELPRVAYGLWEECGYGGVDMNKTVYIDDEGTVTKLDLFTQIDALKLCGSLQSGNLNCGLREDVEMGDISLPNVVKLECRDDLLYIWPETPAGPTCIPADCATTDPDPDDCFDKICQLDSCVENQRYPGADCVTGGQGGTCDADGTCVIAVPPQHLVMGNAAVLFEEYPVYHNGGTAGTSAPAFSGFIYDRERKTMFIADTLDVSAFVLDGLNVPTHQYYQFWTSRSYYTFPSYHCDTDPGNPDCQCPCRLSLNMVVAPRCVGFATSHAQGSRLEQQFIAGEGEFYVHNLWDDATHDSFMLFSTNNGLEFEAEFARIYSTYGVGGHFPGASYCFPLVGNLGDGKIIPRQTPPSGTQGVVYFGSGLPTVDGDYVYFFTTPTGRYGIVELVDDAGLQLIDLSDLENPVDLGPVSPELEKVFASYAAMSVTGTLPAITTPLLYGPPYLVTVIDGSDFVIYDYSDPVNIQELDRFPAPANAEEVLKKVARPILEQGVFYAHKGVLSEPSSGMLYRRQQGSGAAWEATTELPLNDIEFFDGKLFVVTDRFRKDDLYAAGSGAASLDGIFAQVYDLTTGEKLLDEELQVPLEPDIDCELRWKNTWSYSSASFAVQEKDEHYYIYLVHGPFVAIGRRAALVGYELAVDSGQAS